VQVVVAEHRSRADSPSACTKRSVASEAGTAVDEVAAKPQPVAAGSNPISVEQAPQRIQAALQVADGVDRHQCRVPGRASVNAAIGASKCWPDSSTIW
jgi:hypothetical protein